jgi:hypothetical protein
MDQSDLSYIKIPYPHAKDLHLKIIVPTCSLVITPGIGNAWVTGKYNDPKDVAALNIKQTENAAEVIAVGAFAYKTPRKYLPDMALSFGRLHPFALSISAGEMNDKLNLGGIPLSSLEIQYGAGSQIIDFSYPNPQVMNRMKIEADSAQVQIEGMVNANAVEIHLNGDSTGYRLNFGGELKRNTNLHVGMGVSSVAFIIPSSTAVKIKSGSPPTSSRVDDFSYIDKTWLNIPAQAQQEPLLYIHNTASYGSLRIKYL